MEEKQYIVAYTYKGDYHEVGRYTKEGEALSQMRYALWHGPWLKVDAIRIEEVGWNCICVLSGQRVVASFFAIST